MSADGTQHRVTQCWIRKFFRGLPLIVCEKSQRRKLYRFFRLVEFAKTILPYENRRRVRSNGRLSFQKPIRFLQFIFDGSALKNSFEKEINSLIGVGKSLEICIRRQAFRLLHNKTTVEQ